MEISRVLFRSAKAGNQCRQSQTTTGEGNAPARLHSAFAGMTRGERHRTCPSERRETLSKDLPSGCVVAIPVPQRRSVMMKRYAYGWITAIFFLVSIAGHWLFGWYAYVNEAADHGQTPQLSAWAIEMTRDTLENWQSEFLQLIWQVVGLAYFLYAGSPSSKENDDRIEAKIDALMRLHGRDRGEEMIAEIDERFLRTAGHAGPHVHHLSPPSWGEPRENLVSPSHPLSALPPSPPPMRAVARLVSCSALRSSAERRAVTQCVSTCRSRGP